MKKWEIIVLIFFFIVIANFEKKESREINDNIKNKISDTVKKETKKKKTTTEVTLDSFFRYEVINFVAKSTQNPPESFKKKMLDEVIKMYPNSNFKRMELINQVFTCYFDKYPYLYEVKINETDYGHKEDPNSHYFTLTINFFRDFSISEIKAILSEELKTFAKTSSAYVINGFACTENNDRYIYIDGLFSHLHYVRKLDKVLNTRDFTIFKLEQKPKGKSFCPTFDDIVLEKDSQGLFRFTGKTNLPDGFLLYMKLGKFENGSNCEIKNGQIISESFEKGRFSNKIYEIEIYSPIACFQPKSIQALHGKKGEYLEGPNVEISNLGQCKSISSTKKCLINFDQ